MHRQVRVEPPAKRLASIFRSVPRCLSHRQTRTAMAARRASLPEALQQMTSWA